MSAGAALVPQGLCEADARLVRRFAEAMADRLLVNSRERGKSGWQYMTVRWLLRRAEQELGELRRAVERKRPAIEVADEAADVGNFCAMLATVYEVGPGPTDDGGTT